ncbi:alpha/beta hydrolase [Agromyces sp. NPDC049794]|uniref:alpha/beta hydrolase n=1 Tax=unclassified Agromyces TaxID=2639701 RepID=UPI0033E4C3E5
MNGLPDDVVAALRADGREFTPDSIARERRLLAPLHEERGYLAARVSRDLRYGPHTRHRLDVHAPEGASGARPVLLFVHGGGFTGGDKHDPRLPYYDHVGGWAAAAGLLGVTMTYRLAPDHGWPAGAEDVAGAVGWLEAHAHEHGGDPQRIIVMGQSAGGTHVAGYLAGHGGAIGEGVVGGIVLSALYGPADGGSHPMLEVYYGADASAHPARSAIPGLLRANVPLLLGVAELDPSVFHVQAAALLRAFTAEHGVFPPFITVPDHTHVSAIFSLGLDDEAFADVALRFIRRVASPDSK